MTSSVRFDATNSNAKARPPSSLWPGRAALHTLELIVNEWCTSAAGTGGSHGAYASKCGASSPSRSTTCAAEPNAALAAMAPVMFVLRWPMRYDLTRLLCVSSTYMAPSAARPPVTLTLAYAVSVNDS
jgi:hypothetical protein